MTIIVNISSLIFALNPSGSLGFIPETKSQTLKIRGPGEVLWAERCHYKHDELLQCTRPCQAPGSQR